MSINSTLRNTLKTTFPGVWKPAAKWWLNYCQRSLNSNLARITESFKAKHGLRVLNGPFAGMLYVSSSVCSAILPKLIGSYEAELFPVLETLDASAYDQVVDVGCAEGYYAVGFAYKWSSVQVVAFDMEPEARKLCAQLADRNNVTERVRIEGACNVQALKSLSLERTLLVCDCEGYELQLLVPDEIPDLRSCDIIVELHDCLGLTIRPVIVERFTPTHDITILDAVPRDPDVYPDLAFLSEEDRNLAVNELRLPMQWAFLKSRAR